MILWRAEQWSDALAGDELSIAARELGQGILFRAVNSLSHHPPIQPDERTNSQIEGEEDTNLGGRIVQGRESSTIRGDFPLLGMGINFPRPATEEDGAIQIVDCIIALAGENRLWHLVPPQSVRLQLPVSFWTEL